MYDYNKLEITVGRLLDACVNMHCARSHPKTYPHIQKQKGYDASSRHIPIHTSIGMNIYHVLVSLTTTAASTSRTVEYTKGVIYFCIKQRVLLHGVA